MTMKQQIIQLMDKLPDKLIAKRVGCHRAYVRHVRGEIGAPHRTIRIDEERFRALYRAGLSDTAIADQMGHTAAGIWNFRTRLGLARNLAPGQSAHR